MQLVLLANCVEYYCYEFNSTKPVVYGYDAGTVFKIIRKVGNFKS